MKLHYSIFFSLATILMFSSFTSSEACTYAGTNLNYVKARTEEAIATSDINKSRFYIFKAIKVLQTSTDRFNKCGCTDAKVDIEESLLNLKAATKATSVNGTRILLQEALAYTEDAIDNLEQHKIHETERSIEEVDASSEINDYQTYLLAQKMELHRQIDISLEKYTQSINEVVESVNCAEAHAYAKTVYDRCEKTLLIANLSEGKKYYNLRTKQITEEALLRIGDCNGK